MPATYQKSFIIQIISLNGTANRGDLLITHPKHFNEK